MSNFSIYSTTPKYNNEYSTNFKQRKVSNPSFKASSVGEKKSNKKRNILIAVGVGIAAIATALIWKGKDLKAWAEKLKNKPAETQKPSETPSSNLSNTETPKVKFSKGKATLENGEKYTGKIVTETKDGKTIVREYENWTLKTVQKKDGENVIFSKEYYYDNEKIKMITDNEGNTLFKQSSMPNGKLVVNVLQPDGTRKRTIFVKSKGKYKFSKQEITSKKSSTSKPDKSNNESLEQRYKGRRLIIDPEPDIIKYADKPGVQTPHREFKAHSYENKDIPEINITTRTPDKDYTCWDVVDGKTVHAKEYKYREVFDKLNLFEDGQPKLAIGKNSKGEKLVYLQAPVGRNDFCGCHEHPGRPIRAMYIFTVPKDQDFSKVQLDLIKGLASRTPEFIKEELPLARSGKVINPLTGSYGKEDMVFNLDTLLREVNHFAKDQEMTSELLDKIKQVDSMEPGNFIKLI